MSLPIDQDAKIVATEIQRLQGMLQTAREAVDAIVISNGCDAGVILLSSESPTHYDQELKCQVYEYENFSPLGDALVALARLLRKETQDELVR